MAEKRLRGVWYCCGTANTYPGSKYVYSGPMATYCAWHRPMAVYCREVNKTFFVFGDDANSPAISFFDHARGAFAPPITLGRNRDGDAHRNPTLHVDGKGYLTVFYGAHGDVTYVVRSTAPYEIANWTPRPSLNTIGNTYPQPWSLVEGEIFVSFRHSQGYHWAEKMSGWSFRRSRDGAASWTEPTCLIGFRDATAYAVSVGATGPYPRKVHITWSKLGGGTPEEVRTKHLWARRHNVYYACSDDGGTTWKRSDGSAYSLPITEETAERLYESGEHGVWLKDIQLDSAGNPCIIFLDSDVATFESAWKFARRAEGRWQISDITRSDHMYDDGGLVILSDQDFRLYAPTTAVQPHEDGGEIEEWQSTDQGRSWRNTKRLTSGSAYSHNNVKTVFNHQQSDGRFRVFWSYGDSVYPPATKDVDIYYYGEALPAPRRIEVP